MFLLPGLGGMGGTGHNRHWTSSLFLDIQPNKLSWAENEAFFWWISRRGLWIMLFEFQDEKWLSTGIRILLSSSSFQERKQRTSILSVLGALKNSSLGKTWLHFHLAREILKRKYPQCSPQKPMGCHSSENLPGTHRLCPAGSTSLCSVSPSLPQQLNWNSLFKYPEKLFHEWFKLRFKHKHSEHSQTQIVFRVTQSNQHKIQNNAKKNPFNGLRFSVCGWKG